MLFFLKNSYFEFLTELLNYIPAETKYFLKNWLFIVEVLCHGIGLVVGGSLQAHQPASDNIHHQHKALHPVLTAPAAI